MFFAANVKLLTQQYPGITPPHWHSTLSIDISLYGKMRLAVVKVLFLAVALATSIPRSKKDIPIVPEVVGALHLPEAGSGHHTHTSFLQHLEAVEYISRLALLLSNTTTNKAYHYRVMSFIWNVKTEV